MIFENQCFHELIETITALSALFHDAGKSGKFFQKKLRRKNKKIVGDPVRHEFISCIFLCAIVDQLNDRQSDIEFLELLQTSTIDQKLIDIYFEKALENARSKTPKSPFQNLPPVAGLVIWLILSHHRLPVWTHDERWNYEPANSLGVILKRISQRWGYENRIDQDFYDRNVKDCLLFSRPYFYDSKQWKESVKHYASAAIAQLNAFNDAISDGTFRIILNNARLCLMLADYYYSSQDQDKTFIDNSSIYANTDRKTGSLKQKLSEHLVYVAFHAAKIARMLPVFENQLPAATGVNSLKIRSSATAFKWQDTAVDVIKENRKNQPFFIVNVASTGSGKTVANAKIMQALSEDGDSLRYILALGLRTLTLQTGDEYRERIGLDKTQLAVLIGSQAVIELHEKNKSDSVSESFEQLLTEEIDFVCSIDAIELKTVLQSERDMKFLHAHVLACTIDHVIAATETTRGGRFILPQLRLMSSDLVIDEIDDFNGSDLIAIGRLIHMAGMFGRNVMLSSATIPPDLAEGYFKAYKDGLELYYKSMNKDSIKAVSCVLIDEFITSVESNVKDHEQYKCFHEQFINSRIKELAKQKAKRKGLIVDCDHILNLAYKDIKTAYFEAIQDTILNMHSYHCVVDDKTLKNVSFGVVRVANIDPCIELSQYLLKTDWPENVAPKIMTYHSRQVLLLRSEQEKHLDAVLKQKEKSGERPIAFLNPVIREHIDSSHSENVLFIVVCSPVEETGRDHDFDYANAEPSSFRSLIQIAGRVRRHRNEGIIHPNIAIMQYNLRALMYGTDTPAYCHPGYEDSALCILNTHDMKELIDTEEIKTRIDATPRISRNEQLSPKNRLADLEHFAVSSLLTAYDQSGPNCLEGWLSENWWLTALPQKENPFRQSEQTMKLFLMYYRDQNDLFFVEKLPNGGFKKCEVAAGIHHDTECVYPPKRLWLKRDYRESIERFCGNENEQKIKELCLKYGEISVRNYDEINTSYVYSDQFGLKKKS